MLLEAISAALRGECAAWEQISQEQWSRFWDLTRSHKVFPLVYEAVRSLPEAAMEAVSLAKQRRKLLEYYHIV